MRSSRRRAVYVAAPAVMWVIYLPLVLLYTQIRSYGDQWMPWLDGSALESDVFHGHATVWLQAHIYAHDLAWFDFAAFLIHVSWFFIPLVFGIAVTLWERGRLLEYMIWVLATAYASDVCYLLFPMSPPWMEPDVHRILHERAFVEYTALDNNPVAAFPSMHAALPMVLALFFLCRTERLRWLGAPAAAMSLVIGFAVVYLGEHWLIDVVAGWAFAGLMACLLAMPALRRGYDALPGRPISALGRLNAYISTYVPAPAGEPVAVPSGGEKLEAA